MTHATRRRNAAATRGALLAAARELFATEGFERTTVRAVADRAGVNQALLFRYFGNKEALFAEAVTERALAPLHEGPPETLLERILAAMLDDEPGSALFFAVLRSGSPSADAVRDQVGRAYRQAFAGVAAAAHPGVTGQDAQLRADLVLAWLQGIGQARPEGDRRVVVAHVLRAANALLTG
jgi:AcrR family transcriptional regulator